MIVPDVNLLLFAYNTSAATHERAREWWERCLLGDEPVGLVYPVLFGFMRLSTNGRGFAAPYTLAEVSDFINSWLDRTTTRILNEGPGHVSQVVTLLEGAGSTGGNLVTDAQIAAIAIAHKATVHTADRDFMRFRELNCYYPLDDSKRK